MKGILTNKEVDQLLRIRMEADTLVKAYMACMRDEGVDFDILAEKLASIACLSTDLAADVLEKKSSGMSKVKAAFTVDELSDILGVCNETVRRWLRGGQLTGIKMCNRGGYCITAAEVTKFFENWTPPMSHSEKAISMRSKCYAKWRAYLAKWGE